MSCLPDRLYANGWWNILTGRKRYRIVCGNAKCAYIWRAKVPFGETDVAVSACPRCGMVNEWKHSEFRQKYDEHFALLVATESG